MNKLLGGNWFNTVTKIKQYRDNLLIKEDEVKLFGNIGNSLNPPSPIPAMASFNLPPPNIPYLPHTFADKADVNPDVNPV